MKPMDLASDLDVRFNTLKGLRPSLILFLRERLEKLGFEVATAWNVLEGLEILRTESVIGILF